MVVLVLKMWKHAYNIIYSHTDVYLGENGFTVSGYLVQFSLKHLIWPKILILKIEYCPFSNFEWT